MRTSDEQSGSNQLDQPPLRPRAPVDISLCWSIERWPASCRTSRKLPPALNTSRAALVIKVRRPECDEQPSRPSAWNAVANQITMLTGRIALTYKFNRDEPHVGPIK